MIAEGHCRTASAKPGLLIDLLGKIYLFSKIALTFQFSQRVVMSVCLHDVCLFSPSGAVFLGLSLERSHDQF